MELKSWNRRETEALVDLICSLVGNSPGALIFSVGGGGGGGGGGGPPELEGAVGAVFAGVVVFPVAGATGALAGGAVVTFFFGAFAAKASRWRSKS